MSQNFRKFVNAPHKFSARMLKKISDQKPKTKTGKTAKVAGGISVGMITFLLWLTKYATLDNHVLRGTEHLFANMKVGKNKKGKDKKFSAFVKKNPNLSAHILYYTLLAGLTFGGVKYLENQGENSEPNPVKIENVIPEKVVNDTYISPEDEDFINKALDEYWPEIAIALTELETYRAEPKLHTGEARQTSGLGTTWTYTRDGNGNLVQNPNPKSGMASRSKDENFAQVQMHLEYETLKLLQKATQGKTKINRRMAIALVMAGYQRPVDMKYIADRLEKAKTDQEIADAFLYTDGNPNNSKTAVPKKYKAGTWVRRWWCALYALGKIDDADFVSAVRDKFSKIDINTVLKHSHFVLDPMTVQYGLEKINLVGNDDTVENFLSDFEMGRTILGRVNVVPRQRPVIIEEPEIAVVNNSMTFMVRGQREYNNGDYDAAAKSFENAIAADADNMEAYSSLALTYKILGDKAGNDDKALEWYDKAAKTVVQCNRRMNLNKELLLDYVVKANSYYNAGIAREAMGDIYKRHNNIAKANEQYNLAKKNYQNALENYDKADVGGENSAIYSKAIDRTSKKVVVQSKNTKTGNGQNATAKPNKGKKDKKDSKTPAKKKKGKRTAFVNGKNKVKQNAFMKGLIAFHNDNHLA